nr:hydantoinase B/oxoprolinase family protein [Marinicella sp. W31]MDC2879736.1 hydantoinase B/oxoprolinase family protein [Marinicella sp. W31]
MTEQQLSDADIIALNVMWNRLISVCEEQANALLRVAFGAIVREAGDLSAGIFDARGRMMAQAVTGTPDTSIPWPSRSMPCSRISRPKRLPTATC